MKYSKIILMILFLIVIVYPGLCDNSNEKSLLVQGTGSGTSDDPYNIPKAEMPIKLDGKLDDQEWGKALKLNVLYESWPGDGTPSPISTECYLTYDNTNFYVAFRAVDPDPSKIRAFYFERDNIWYDDFVLIFMDTFNDERRAYGIRSNPLGVQCDNIRTRENPSVEWDGIYDSVGHIYDWGYAVEMAIPFNQLRFQQTTEDQVWGINLRRLYPRRALYHFDSIKVDRNNDCFMCQFIKIKGFKEVKPGRNVEFVPSLTFSRTEDRPNFPAGDFQKRDQKLEPSLTTIWGITPNMTLSGTVNPDFSQVEADALQLDINQPFALSYEERRTFFVEGSEYFSTNLNAVYTRTMRDPSWGFKVTGKIGANTIGAYVVRDTLTNLIFPGSQGSQVTSLPTANISSVLRYKRDFGHNYTLGLLVTDREADNYFNRLIGIDGDWRLTSKDFLRLQFLGSNTRYPDNIAQTFGQDKKAFGGTALDFKYIHDARNLDFSLNYQDLTDGFRADLGFMPQVNYRCAQASSSYTWVGNQNTWYKQLCLTATAKHMVDHDGNLISSSGNLQFQFDGALQSIIIGQLKLLRENYSNIKFNQLQGLLYTEIKPSRRVEMNFTAIFGDRIDYSNVRLGQRVTLQPAFVLKPGRHMRFELSHIFENLKVDTGRVYTANISQFSGTYHFNVRAFFRAVLQYTNYNFNVPNYTFPIAPKRNTFFTQLLFSYELNPRTVLFLGYSDDYFGNIEYSLTQTDRTFFAKVSYALSL